MKQKNRCPVCKGTGYEKHSYVREDGEEVSERIVCELCSGSGKIVCKDDTSRYSRETVSFEEEMLREKRSMLDYTSWDEDEYY